MIDNQIKDFRVVVFKSRKQEATKEFITSYIPKGNNIVTEGWSSYEWIDLGNSGYTCLEHIHVLNDFGYGIEYTWGQLKSQIKSIHYTIPNIDFLY